MKRCWHGLLAGALLVMVGCSDDEPTAKERFCSQRSKVATEVEAMLSDVSGGNFGNARDRLKALPAEIQQLRTDAADLDDDLKVAIQPSLDELTSAFDAIGDASSLADLSAALDAAKTAFGTALDAVRAAASC